MPGRGRMHRRVGRPPRSGRAGEVRYRTRPVPRSAPPSPPGTARAGRGAVPGATAPAIHRGTRTVAAPPPRSRRPLQASPWRRGSGPGAGGRRRRGRRAASGRRRPHPEAREVGPGGRPRRSAPAGPPQFAIRKRVGPCGASRNWLAIGRKSATRLWRGWARAAKAAVLAAGRGDQEESGRIIKKVVLEANMDVISGFIGFSFGFLEDYVREVVEQEGQEALDRLLLVFLDPDLEP